MFRLRDAVAAVALATSGVGCATFCDECHEFPVPGRFAAIPGSYTGPPLDGDSRRGDAAYAPPSPTATRESGATVAPSAPQSDDGAGVAPPPPAPASAAPFTPPAP
ncbi:MAG: hypothetical protein BGO49_06340 [Planctomycetales bacterium 71-10]|nr:MAG: hypothetical protein BGO49_06340 [Planctomycetales bacterium 71-10]